MAEEQTTSPSVANAEEEQTTPLPETNVELKQDKKRKRKAPKKASEASKKKARKNLTLELSKPEFLQGIVRFDDIVLVKVGERQTMMLLKGYSLGNSLFARKRNYQKLRLHQKHQQRELTPKRMKIQQHVRDTLAKVNL